MKRRTAVWALGLVFCCWVGLFAIRASAPWDLLDNDQERPCAYTLDVLVNGHWLCQTDDRGDIASKPPLPTWIAAALALPARRLTRFGITLVPALFLLAAALATLGLGYRLFGPRAATLAALFLLLSSVGLKEVVLVRTDPIFAALCFLSVCAAWRAIRRGRGWWLFWLCAALATLTKGPLGPLLAGCALLSRVRLPKERRSLGHPREHWLGVGLILLLAGGWFLAARMQMGQALVDKLLNKELVGHAVKDIKGRLPGHGLPKPSLYFLARFAPWSLLGALGVWRVFRRPAASETARELERFLASYFLGGLLIFSIAPHQRADHLMPLIPAAALLAGREAARLRLFRGTRAPIILGGAGLLVLGLYTHLLWARHPVVQESESLERFAKKLELRIGQNAPLQHLGTRFTLQFHLGTMTRRIDRIRALELLSGKEPAVVAIQDRELKRIAAQLPSSAVEVAHWPEQGEPSLRILRSDSGLPSPPCNSPDPRPWWTVLITAILSGLLLLVSYRKIRRWTNPSL